MPIEATYKAISHWTGLSYDASRTAVETLSRLKLVLRRCGKLPDWQPMLKLSPEAVDERIVADRV